MSREDEARERAAEQMYEQTNAAVAKWMHRIRDGMSVDEAIRAAYMEGVSDGLGRVIRMSGETPKELP